MNVVRDLTMVPRIKAALVDDDMFVGVTWLCGEDGTRTVEAIFTHTSPADITVWTDRHAALLACG